jgi:hypothetical protein
MNKLFLKKEGNKKLGQLLEQHEHAFPEQSSAASLISRRKMLAALGVTGIAALATNALTLLPQTAEAAKVYLVYNIMDYGAAGNGTTDDTAAINAAITAASTAGGGKVYIPRGLYMVDPSVGLVLKKGIWIEGDGKDVSVLTAKTVAGSVFRRDWNPSPLTKGENPYLQDLFISHIAIVMNHPSTASPSNYMQIGFDFRNITRSTIFECYVGNYKRGSLVKADPPSEPIELMGNNIQGYGIIFGNVAASDYAYCGGEVNSVINTTVWGAKKAIIMDDATLSPLSSAHATYINNCDIQVCELGIGSESQYTAGIVIENNVVQAVRRAINSSNSTYCYRLEGYGNRIIAGYVESNTETDYLIRLGATSKRNRVVFDYFSSNGAISDVGSHNIVQTIDQTTGVPKTYNNKVMDKKVWVIFDSTGAITAGTGVQNVVRLAAGDFLINWDEAFPTSLYQVSYSCKVNESGDAGIIITKTLAVANVRIHTYKVLTSGAVSQVDCESVTVYASLF